MFHKYDKIWWRFKCRFKLQIPLKLSKSWFIWLSVTYYNFSIEPYLLNVFGDFRIDIDKRRQIAKEIGGRITCHTNGINGPTEYTHGNQAHLENPLNSYLETVVFKHILHTKSEWNKSMQGCILTMGDTFRGGSWWGSPNDTWGGKGSTKVSNGNFGRVFERMKNVTLQGSGDVQDI